ncbi:MAG: DnaA regulatory inactivator Hda [Cellvibrionaceae bacterium]
MYKQIPLAISPDTALTFDNFYQTPLVKPIISELKKFISTKEVCSSDQVLYLWGAHDSGITHLLNASQNENASLAMQYLPLKELVHYSPQDILEGLELLDLVCIDDIDCLETSPEWEQGLFHLYNRLRDAGKRILIGGHKPPAQLSLSLPDLQSRLQWGVTLHLNELSDDDKPSAIQFCADKLGMQLSDEVAHFLLQRMERSPQTLFDFIKQLDHHSLAEQRKLTIPFVKIVLKESLSKS